MALLSIVGYVLLWCASRSQCALSLFSLALTLLTRPPSSLHLPRVSPFGFGGVPAFNPHDNSTSPTAAYPSAATYEGRPILTTLAYALSNLQGIRQVRCTATSSATTS